MNNQHLAAASPCGAFFVNIFFFTIEKASTMSLMENHGKLT
jgi:hypothetical protein